MAESELKTRVISAVFFVIILFSCVFFSEYTLAALLVFISITGVFEMASMARTQGLLVLKIPAIAGTLITFGTAIAFTIAYLSVGFRSSDLFVAASVFSIWLVLTMIYTMIVVKEKNVESLALTVFTVFYLALPMSLLLSLAADDKTGEFVPWRVMFLFFFMWASDTGAYFSGRFFGKHKLFERLSPKKTIEGFIGGLLTSMLVGLAGWKFFGTSTWYFWCLAGALLSVAGTFGDLLESMFKRRFGVKDSGRIMPGHGGVLDRFDSTFLAAPVYWVIWNWVG